MSSSVEAVKDLELEESVPTEGGEKNTETTPMAMDTTTLTPTKPDESKSEKEKKTEEKTETKTKDDKPALAQHDSSVLDLAFAMDCTGSMGSYIKKAQSSIRQIVEEIVSTEKSDIRLALVEYRDHPPQDSSFVTRVLDFTPSVSKMKKQLDKCSASGGGDCPEAVADALHQLTKLAWRPEATKICVFIADAPPHGLGCNGDGFPNGCPDGLDPMETSGVIAEKGITMYMVGCEPAITRYRDFFMTIAHMTGGQYVPLSNAELLAKVIIGGAQEEITLERLMQNMEAEVEAEVLDMGGWDRYADHEEEIASRVMSKVNARGFMNKQLQLGGSSLPEATARAKKWSNMKKMSDVRKEYVEDGGDGSGGFESRAMRSSGAMHRKSASPRSSGKKRGGFLNFMGFGGSAKSSSAAAPPAMAAPTMTTMAMSDDLDMLEDDGMDMLGAPPASSSAYHVEEKDSIDAGQAKRMLQKMKNKKK